MQLVTKIDIAAPIDVAFTTAFDVDRWPEFISGIERIDVLGDGRIHLGASFRETRTMFGRVTTEEMTIVELSPPHSFVLTARNHGTNYRAEHHFVEIPQGSRLTLRFQGQPETLLACLLSPIGRLLLSHVRRKLDADLRDVKAEAERRTNLRA